MENDRLREIVDLVVRIRHDASNPLTAALGNVQLMLEDSSVPEGEVREGLEVVETELRRLARILRELNAVRLESDESELD